MLARFLCVVFCSAFFTSSAAEQDAKNLTPLADNSQGLNRKLLTFEVDKLKQHALFIVNDNQGLKSQNLVVIAHGFHPDPPNYGRVKSGKSLRPGDYYRQWVELYALAGFNVLIPDYRGHNESQGYEYTHQAKLKSFPEQFYTKDVVASVRALEASLQITYQNIAIVGHSMGGPIAFQAAQRLGSKVKVASLWSSAEYKFDDNFSHFPEVPNFVIHHGKADQVTPIKNCEYYQANYDSKLIQRYVYETDLHMLTGEMLEQGVKRDVAIIKRLFNGE